MAPYSAAHSETDGFKGSGNSSNGIAVLSQSWQKSPALAISRVNTAKSVSKRGSDMRNFERPPSLNGGPVRNRTLCRVKVSRHFFNVVSLKRKAFNFCLKTRGRILAGSQQT